MTYDDFVTQAERDALVSSHCTLDGKPATIMGRLEPFPHVRAFGSGQRVEYSWAAVRRIMGRDGAFKS